MTALRHLVSSPVEKGHIGLHEYIALEHLESQTGSLVRGVEIEKREDNHAVAYERGDVLFGKLRPYLHKVYKPEREGICSGELLVLRPDRNQLHDRYLFFLALSKPFVDWATASSYGVKMPRTSWELLGRYQVPAIDLRVQQLIADFLDGEMKRIDALSDAKRRLIDLLAEKRTALITHAVTKGLDPSVPMKDSGNPLIGAVPSNWFSGCLKHYCSQITVGIVVQPARLYEDSGVPCLRGANVKPGFVSDVDLARISEVSNQLHMKSKLRENDLVVVRTGQAGAAAVVPDWAVGGNCVDLLVIRPSSGLDPSFLEFLLNSPVTTRQVERESVGAIQSHYNVEALRELVVVVPPIDTQRRIVDHLTTLAGAVSQTMAVLLDQLTLLAEYRQALITAAVTGQLDEETLKGSRPTDEATGMEVPS